MCVYLTDVIDLMLRTAFIIVHVNQRKLLFLTVPVVALHRPELTENNLRLCDFVYNTFSFKCGTECTRFFNKDFMKMFLSWRVS